MQYNTSPAQVLTFNSFTAWSLAGIMTKLVLGQQQYIKKLAVMTTMDMDEASVMAYEANKVLSLKRISHWENTIFLPTAAKLLCTLGRQYILDAARSALGPMSLQSKLIISASELLLECLSDRNMTLGPTTGRQIKSWFDFVVTVRDGPLWPSFDNRTRTKILDILQRHLEVVYPSGHTEYRHFSAKSLFLTHAFVVHLIYGYPSKITTKIVHMYSKEAGVTRTQIYDNDVNDNQSNDEGMNSEDDEQEVDRDDEEAGDEDSEDDDIANQPDEHQGQNVDRNDEEPGDEDSEDDEIANQPHEHQGHLHNLDNDVEMDHVPNNAVDWMSVHTDWSSATFSYLSPLFQIELWRNNRSEQNFPYLGVYPSTVCRNQFDRCLTLRPHEMFQSTLELVFSRFHTYQYHLGPAPVTDAYLQNKILADHYDQVKKMNHALRDQFKNQEKNARFHMRKKPYKFTRPSFSDDCTFLFGDLYCDSFSRVLHVTDDLEGAF